MNSSSFLDYSITFFEIYGIWCMLALVFLFFAGLWIGTALENKKSKEEKNKVVTKKMLIKTVAVISIPFLAWLFVAEINPSYTGYGYATNGIDFVAHADSIMWASDYYTKSAGNRGSIATFRIRGINLNTGKIAFKKLISQEYKIEGYTNQMVWMKMEDEDELVQMNIIDGKTIATITKKTLAANIPEFSSGVFEFRFNPKTLLLDVTTSDGLNAALDPTSNKIIASPVEQTTRSLVDDKSINNHAEYNILSLISIGEREHLEDSAKKTLPGNLFFLKGKFIELDTVSRHPFTFSYETLDKTNFLIRCISMDGKLLWEAKQNELGAIDFFEAQPRLLNAFLYKDNLILALDGFVISLNAKTGKQNWISRV